MNDLLKVAVITGGHVFDAPNFTQLWRTLPGIDAVIQDLENFAADVGHCRDDYDVLLFYNMHREAPTGKELETLKRLGQTKQGIVLLHHAILAFQPWEPWAEMSGLHFNWEGFAYSHGERMQIHIEDPQHPITEGLTDWTITDESYLTADAAPDNHLLLSTEHPDCMHTIAWVRQYGQARVFGLELGHDAEAWQDDTFRALVLRGIYWTAERLDAPIG